MIKNLMIIGGFILMMIAISCGSSPEKKLIGTWKVTDVNIDFDESKVSPEMLSQIIEMQKQTYFRIINDSVMVIISNDNTHETKWALNTEDNVITFFFEGMETKSNKLGVYTDNNIISETNTPLGKMTTYYEKE